MTVISFHQHFSTPKGSAGIRSYKMAECLLAGGHQVIMVCGSFDGGQTGLSKPFVGGLRRGIVDGIDIIEFDLAYSNADSFVNRGLTFMKFALRSIGLAFTEEYDVLFATTTPLTAGIPGIFSRWLRGKPFVFEVRDLWPELPRAMGVIRNPLVLGAMSVLEWASYRSAHRLLGLSPGIVEGIAHRGVSRDCIDLVPNGCDLGIFAGEVQPWRPDQVNATDLMALFAGTHGMANGLDAVLNAASKLKSRGRDDIKLVLIGQGKLKAVLQARAAREGLDNVVFLDPVNKAKLAGLMAATDIGLQILANVPAFYYGTSPNKFFDYIAASLPVLNNYPGWLAEIITEHRDALKVLGQRGRALAETQFDRIKLADRWVDWVTGVKS